MRIPKQIMETVWKNYPTQIHGLTFPDGEDEAVSIYGGIGIFAWLRVNGDIWETDWEIDGIYSDVMRLSEDSKATRFLVIAIRRIPELKAALPPRPESATTCSKCTGSGFTDFADHPQFLICFDCHGLGWIAS